MLPSPTPSTQVVTDHCVSVSIGYDSRFRQQEMLALQAPAALSTARLAIVAHGEACGGVPRKLTGWPAVVLRKPTTLPAAFAMAALRGEDTAAVLVSERRSIQETALVGDTPGQAEDIFDGNVIYVLVKLNGRWKVERIHPL